MKILVVGGAGYIGSHAVRRLAGAGHEVSVLDSLVLGHRESVPPRSLTVGDLVDREFLGDFFGRSAFDVVMHFAAFACVPESVRDPAIYYRNNVVGSLNLIDAMRASGVKRLVFSSTCATYGVPEAMPITEATPQRPINPYGYSKLVIENTLADYARAYGLSYAILRYFNACGAASDASIGEDHTPETHLIPIVLQAALGLRKSVAIFGTDYPTPDGTCIRDYVHVEDLAAAHEAVLGPVCDGRSVVYNVATGRGYSVRKVIASARRITGRPIPVVEEPRRPGDPPELVASADAIRRDLGFVPRYTDIDSIVRTAWDWHRKRPNGYGDCPAKTDPSSRRRLDCQP